MHAPTSGPETRAGATAVPVSRRSVTPGDTHLTSSGLQFLAAPLIPVGRRHISAEKRRLEQITDTAGVTRAADRYAAERDHCRGPGSYSERDVTRSKLIEILTVDPVKLMNFYHLCMH